MFFHKVTLKHLQPKLYRIRVFIENALYAEEDALIFFFYSPFFYCLTDACSAVVQQRRKTV